MPCRLVALLPIALPVIAAPVPKALNKPPSLDGVWRLVEMNGTPCPEATTDAVTWVVDGERVSWRVGGAETLRVRLERPLHDLSGQAELHSSGPSPATQPGVFESEGDDLRVCVGSAGGKRPADCSTGPDRALFVFTRVKEK